MDENAVTDLANAQTEKEVDDFAAKLNAAIQQNGKKTGAAAAPSKRLEFLDELRGLCVLVMLFYHSCYVLAHIYGSADARAWFEAMSATIQPVFAGLFILISGYCARFSKDLKKRGLILAIWALAITLVSRVFLPWVGIELVVWFGILHFLAASKLLLAVGHKLYNKKRMAFIGMVASLLLFNFTSTVRFGYLSLFNRWWHVNLPDALYGNNALAWLGFYTTEFAQAQWDLFPLLPYFFLFLFGAFLSRIAAKDDSLPKFCYRKNITPLGWLGRRSLIIYLLHMPVIVLTIYFLSMWAA